MSGMAERIALIRASGLFDENWYLQANPDVAMLGLDPVEHYLRVGARLLRDPGPLFKARYYLDVYPDVARSGANPLLHYLQFGMQEGRSAAPHATVLSTARHGVDVVVPVFDALDDVRRCLDALRTRKDGFDVRVVVVDDGSGRETADWLRGFCASDPSFELITLDANRGYTRAVNAGLKAARAPYVVALNSDTIVTRGWLRRLVRCMESDPRLGIVGPLSNAASWQNVPELHDRDDGFAINALPAGTTPDDMAAVVASVSGRDYPRVPFVNGFCFMVRREVFDAIGYMDEAAFPLGYGEENDFCLRAADAGFELAIADDCYVFHAKSRSFGAQRRQELSREGDAALRRKHAPARIDALLEQARRNDALKRLRGRLREALGRQAAAVGPGAILAQRIVFLLPVGGSGGGAHSIVQEAAEMRRLGVAATVAVRREDLDAFQANYRDVACAQELFVAFDKGSLATLAAGADVVVATTYDSMALLRDLVAAHPHLLPAYYVQDYEPLFFPEGTDAHAAARASYTLVPRAVLIAKTHWLAGKVRAEHGVAVHKVEPSLDHDTYRPRARRDDGRVHVTAMIRPNTPRRGAERTLRVLARLARAFPERVAVHLFGCEPAATGAPGFAHTHHGVLRRPEVAELLAASDLFVDLSDYQAFGRTALEAMACGCAAMVPVHGGSDEYALDGDNALVVDPFDEEAVYARLAAIVDDTPALRRMQVRGLVTAARYTLRAAALSELIVLATAREARADQARAAMPLPLPPPAQATPPRALAAVPTPAVTPSAPAARATGKLPITALVITWDVGHNPLGRSYMLAEVLDRVVRNVVIMGFQFPRYGDHVWEPVRDGVLPVISLPGRNFPQFLDDLDALAGRLRPDVVIACKARLPSVQLGALIKHKFGCPLVVDVDDHELSFFKDGREVRVDELARMEDGALRAQDEPYNGLWTGVAEHLCRQYADEIIVSNVALQREFQGTIVAHVRDEGVFDPARHDRLAMREKYGVPVDCKVVLFFGTPRHHKGINVLAEAVNRIPDPRYKLVVVGSTTDLSVTAKLDALAPGRIIYLPNQPFTAIPEIVAMADVICLPQDEANPISHYQLPAKAIDAVAMGIPLLVTPTAPLMQLVGDGVARVADLQRLPEMLQEAGADAARRAWAEQVRPRFLAGYSYAAAAESLRALLLRALRGTQRPVDDLPEFLAQQRRLLAAPAPPRPARAPGIDIVVFWKQNDSGMYGRRSDMIIRYLASRADVRRVVVFDAPCSEHDLLVRRRKAGGLTQDRMIYTTTYEKVFGKHDTDKVSFNVWVHPPGIYRQGDDGTARPRLVDGYADYLAGVFEREGVDPANSVFWIFPKNFLAADLIDRFGPAKVVTDVVDDHRAWPGISDAERDRLTENYREILARSDVALANCEPVVESMRSLFPAIRLVPNGCDDRGVVVAPKDDPEFDAFVAAPGPKIGFVGNLEAKIDIALIAKVAQAFPQCRIALLGSTHANPGVVELRRFPNVQMPGVVPYEQVGAWMSHFDVGIIPHIDMPLTRSMNPLKLYVYLAWRVPVVSTEIYNIDRTTSFVKVAGSHDEFIARVAEIVDHPRADYPGLDEFIRANNWEARMRPPVDGLLASMHDRSQGR